MRILAVLCVLLMASPALAGLSDAAELGPSYAKVITPPGAGIGTLDDPALPHVYEGLAANGYYHPISADEYWSGDLYVTTEPGAFTMEAFHAGFSAGGTATTAYIDFFDSDGYYPNANNYVGGFGFTFMPGYAYQFEYVIPDGYELSFATNEVWMTYSFDVHDGATGPLHVDTETIGTNYFSNGWIEFDATGYHWWWYGGAPNADLYGAIAVPEPASLALLGLGVVALLRRRR